MRFMDIFANVEATGFCWHWTRSINAHGYGQLYHHGTTVGAHRLVYELLVGPIPEGLQLDHLCRVRSCVNPDHLEPVTRAENLRRAKKYRVKKYQPRQKDDPKYRGSVLTLEVCVNGHDLAMAGVYSHTTPKGQKVSRCLECKKMSVCNYTHIKTGCTPKCALQLHLREDKIPT